MPKSITFFFKFCNPKLCINYIRYLDFLVDISMKKKLNFSEILAISHPKNQKINETRNDLSTRIKKN